MKKIFSIVLLLMIMITIFPAKSQPTTPWLQQYGPISGTNFVGLKATMGYTCVLPVQITYVISYIEGEDTTFEAQEIFNHDSLTFTDSIFGLAPNKNCMIEVVMANTVGAQIYTILAQTMSLSTNVTEITSPATNIWCLKNSVHYQNVAAGKIEIFDFLGRNVSSFQTSETGTGEVTPDLPSGIYVATLFSKEGAMITKKIKIE